MHLIAESDIDQSLGRDHIGILCNYAKQVDSQILINEFMKSSSSTLASVRNHTDKNIHAHDVFDLHPRGKIHKQRILAETSNMPGIFLHETTPLEVNQKSIEENGPYDLIYVLLPFYLEQSPNTVSLVVAETLKLWYWALSPNGIMCGIDYNKSVIRNNVDDFAKTRKLKIEKYLNTNWDRPDLPPDYFMFAIQKDG